MSHITQTLFTFFLIWLCVRHEHLSKNLWYVFCMQSIRIHSECGVESKSQSFFSALFSSLFLFYFVKPSICTCCSYMESHQHLSQCISSFGFHFHRHRNRSPNVFAIHSICFIYFFPRFFLTPHRIYIYIYVYIYNLFCFSYGDNKLKFIVCDVVSRCWFVVNVSEVF